MAPQMMCDVAVIGGGGAGLTAALYTARAELTTVLFEKNIAGGQIAITDLVENFPGFPEGIMGSEIAFKMEEQAKKYGADIRFEEVVGVQRAGDCFLLQTTAGVCRSRALIVATGAQCRMLNVRGEKELIGKGVSYCATCDAPFFRNKTVAVIGGGDAAIQEGLFLTKFVKQLYIIHRRDSLRAGPLLQERARTCEKISFVWDTVVEEIAGTTNVEAVLLRNRKTNVSTRVAVDGVFVFIGHDPASQLVKDHVPLDEDGYVVAESPGVPVAPGIFVCGEIRRGATWQLVASCGEGCQAALGVQHFLEKQPQQTRVSST